MLLQKKHLRHCQGEEQDINQIRGEKKRKERERVKNNGIEN